MHEQRVHGIELHRIENSMAFRYAIEIEANWSNADDVTINEWTNESMHSIRHMDANMEEWLHKYRTDEQKLIIRSCLYFRFRSTLRTCTSGISFLVSFSSSSSSSSSLTLPGEKLLIPILVDLLIFLFCCTKCVHCSHESACALCSVHSYVMGRI